MTAYGSRQWRQLDTAEQALRIAYGCRNQSALSRRDAWDTLALCRDLRRHTLQ